VATKVNKMLSEQLQCHEATTLSWMASFRLYPPLSSGEESAAPIN